MIDCFVSAVIVAAGVVDVAAGSLKKSSVVLVKCVCCISGVGAGAGEPNASNKSALGAGEGANALNTSSAAGVEHATDVLSLPKVAS